ncbi:MAG: type II secretion system secretin GspD [Rubrivivax sp.]|nr:type II secretion system secretin GspD [Rubrivivax sp.]
MKTNRCVRCQSSAPTPRTDRARRWKAVVLAACLAASLPPALAAEPRAATGGAPVTVNFVNADIEAVTRAFAAMIGRQIAVDPRVRGTMTVYSEQPQSIEQAYRSYLAALRGLGFAVVETGGLLKVVPEADAKLQTGTVSVGEVAVRGDQIITQIFQLRFESPNNLVAVLRPLISANNTINANPASNSLVITDYAENLQRIARIIAALDQPASTGIEVIPLQHAVASDLAPLVQRLAGGTGAPVPPGAPAAAGAGGVTVLPEPRSNALIVRAPNAARLAEVRATVQQLDRPTSGIGPGGGFWVVYLKNADAVRLAAVLRAAFPSGGGGTGGGSSAPSPATSALPSTSVSAATGAGTATGASPQATAPVTGSAAPVTGGFIQADPATNALIITGPEPLYRQVRAMIEQLDTRRAQVYIESIVVEIAGDNAADFGFQWQGLLGQEGDKYGLFGGTNFSTGGSNIIGLTQTITGQGQGAGPAEGFNIALLRNYGGVYALAAIAQFLQKQGNTNIISTPNLITLDNEEAKIVVGQNVPFITGQFTTTGNAVTNPFQTIERRDVGLTLRIRPQIGESGTVRMTIFQESSDVVQQAPGTLLAGPTTTKRSIESQVVVDDGQIIVLGGLIQDRYEETQQKVPLLGDLPVVGALFRSQTRSRNRSNLMVFLRPVVMRDGESVNRLSLDRYDEMRAVQQGRPPSPSIVFPVPDPPALAPVRPPADATPAAPGAAAPPTLSAPYPAARLPPPPSAVPSTPPPAPQ